MRLKRALFAALVFCAAASGQTGDLSRELEVTALDTRGKPIPGASVRLCNLDVSADSDGCADQVTDESGVVRLSLQPVAHYEVRVAVDGFLPTTLGPLRLRESERAWVTYGDLVAVLNDETVF